MGLRKKDILNVISFFQSLKGVVRRFGMSRVTQYFRYSQYISLNPQWVYLGLSTMFSHINLHSNESIIM